MGLLQNITNLFKSTDAKLERISTLEFELEQIDEIKNLLSEQYSDITKALGSDDFTCKEEVKFSDIDYVRQLAQLKSREKSFLKELDILKSNEDVFHRLKDKERLEAVKIIKSLYRDGKIGLSQYNEVAAEKDEEGATKYADVIVINNKNEFLLLKRSTFEDKHQGAWVIPGGHVDAGEDFETAAKRELLEESGISVDKLYQNEKITGVTWYHVGTYTDKSAHIEYYCLNIQDPQNVEILLDELESRDYKWVPIEEVDNYPMVFNMKDNVKEVMDWDAHAQVKVIEKALTHKYLRKEFKDGKWEYIYDEKHNENFNKWFGDSKVVDKTGAPLEVYHGTPDITFNEFSPDVPAVHRKRENIGGIYFTPSQMTASNYRKGGRVISAYLKIENPLDITPLVAKHQKKGMTFMDAKLEALKSLDKTVHDGVIFRGNSYNNPEYTVFSANQIKSSTKNSGDFDINSGDFKKSEDEDIEKAFNTVSQLYVQGQISDELYQEATTRYTKTLQEFAAPIEADEVINKSTHEKWL